MFGVAILWQELALERRILLRGKKWWRRYPALTIVGVNLVVEELLDVINGQKMLAIHRNDYGVPDLRYKDLLCKTISSGETKEVHKRHEPWVCARSLGGKLEGVWSRFSWVGRCRSCATVSRSKGPTKKSERWRAQHSK